MNKKAPGFYDEWAFVVASSKKGPVIKKVKVASLKKSSVPRRSVLEPRLGEQLESAFAAAVKRAKIANSHRS